MRFRSRSLVAVVVLALGTWSGVASHAGAPDGGPTEPEELGIREQVKRGLVQLDVTVSGPPEVIPRLTADDFDLVVGNLSLGGRPIVDLTLDRFCLSPDSSRNSAPPSPSRRPDDAPPRASYVFYFDRTISGFATHEPAHEMVRELIDELVDIRSAATIISGGRTLRTYAYNTSDRGELHAALGRLALEAAEQDSTITFPYLRLGELRQAMRWSRGTRGLVRERSHRYQQEEIDRTYLALTRLSGVMPGLADLPLPKALFYIGTRLNSRPGQVYFDVYGRPFDSLDIGGTDPWAAAQDFDRVIQGAATAGVRIYPIFPAGPTHSMDPKFMRALKASHWSMRALARETGGQDFFWGVPVSRIVKKLKADLSCTYVLSFDPGSLPKDERLGVDLRVNRPKVEARTRAQIVVRSAQQRREAELFAAFLTEDDAGPLRLTAEIVAAGVDDENAAILRVVLPASASPEATWNIGIWLARDRVVHRQAVQQAIAPGAGLPVVVEHPMRIQPGPFELIIVAHEPEGDRIVSERLAVEWPDRVVDPSTRRDTN